MKFEKRIVYLEQERCLEEGEFLCDDKNPCCDGLYCCSKEHKCKRKDDSGNKH